MTRNIKDLFILTVGHVSQAVILLATTRIMTALLSPQEMGRFSIIYTIIALVLALSVSSVSTYMQRRIIEWKRSGTIRFYIRRYLEFLFAMAVLSTGLILLLKHLVGISVDISDLWIVCLVMGLVFVSNLNLCFIGNLNIFKKRLWFTLCSNLTLVAGLLAAVVLVLIFSRRAEHWILGQIIGQLILAVIGGILFYKIVPPLPGLQSQTLLDSAFLADIFRFVWPLSVSSIIIWVQSQSYRFIMESLHGMAVVGFFTVGFNLGSRLVEKIYNLLINFYDPIFFTDIANSDREQRVEAWNSFANFFIPAMVMFSLYICCGGHFLARIFFAPAFRPVSGEVIFWGGAVMFLLTIVSAYKKVGIADLKMTGLIAPYTLGACVTLAGVLFLSKENPYHGVGLALFLGSLSMTAYLMLKMHWLLPVRFPLQRTAWAVLAALPMAGVLMFLRQHILMPSLGQAAGILGLAGLYQLAIQAALSKKWLVKSHAQ